MVFRAMPTNRFHYLLLSISGGDEVLNGYPSRMSAADRSSENRSALACPFTVPEHRGRCRSERLLTP